MKLLLIYPPRRFDSYMFPPTPLLYIAQAARAAGHEAEIVDVPYLLEKYPDKYSLLDNSVFEYIFSKDCDKSFKFTLHIFIIYWVFPLNSFHYI